MAIHLAILHVRAQTRHVSDRLQALAICESLPWAVCLNFRHLAHAIERFAIFASYSATYTRTWWAGPINPHGRRHPQSSKDDSIAAPKSGVAIL